MPFLTLKNLDETTIYFNYYADSLSRDNIRNFIDVDIKSDSPTSDLNIDNLRELTQWFFEKNKQNKSRIIGDSKHLSMLDTVLSNAEATEYFQQGSGSILDAYQIVSVTADSFSQEIEMSLSGLKRAQNIIHKVDKHHDTIKTKLKEVSTLARNMEKIVTLSEEDNWDD